ncbi:hypothetical protein D8B46_01075 [Candidatus Gracilibacteria bacterium]|nr:MAG: hypothetical protein D8B46_01075 [Candidatus Gracilibacteria bacterium]
MTTRRNRYSGHNSFSKNIKDYIVPIIGGILILFLIWSLFLKGGNKAPVNDENRVGIAITKDADSGASISYAGGSKRDISEVKALYKGEKITVSSGRVKLSDANVSINLNKLGELKYLENGVLSLYSGEAWVDTNAAIDMEMRFVKLKIPANAHISLSQNEVMSTIYVISGNVEVSNLKGKSTVVKAMEKIEIARELASDEKADLELKKQPIDSFFTKSSWFTVNNGESYVNSSNTGSTDDKTGTGSATGSTKTGTGKTIKSKSGAAISGKSKLLTFSNLLDESNVSSNPISVSGAYDTEEVAKIEVNGKIATLNPETGTFKVEGVSVPNKSNDLVFKVFNKDEELKEKFVYTVYYEAGASGTNGGNSGNDSTFKVNTFEVDGSKFAFTSPTRESTYTTFEDFVTIRGYVSATGIDKVSVNDFVLKSFDGKNWRYHARTDYGNLANGTNVYEIKYFSGETMVYKNYFTIIKKDNSANTQTTTTTKTNENQATGTSTKKTEDDTEEPVRTAD